MRYWLLVLVFASACSSYAGVEAQAYISAQLTPGISHRILFLNHKALDEQEDLTAHVLKIRNEREHLYVFGSAGVVAGVRFNNFAALESGCSYAHYSYRYTDKTLTFSDGTPMDTSYGSYKPSRMNFLYGFHYINIPLGVRFSAGKSALKADIGTGLEMNVLVEKYRQLHITHPDGSTYSKGTPDAGMYPHQRLNLSAYLSVGVSYQFKNSVVLSFAPIGRFQCLYNTKNTPITERLWSVGVQMGVTYYISTHKKAELKPNENKSGSTEIK